MKRIILSVIVLLCMSSVAGQSTDVVYKVTNYSINGENYDDIALEEDVSLAFYLNEEDHSVLPTSGETASRDRMARSIR